MKTTLKLTLTSAVAALTMLAPALAHAHDYDGDRDDGYEATPPPGQGGYVDPQYNQLPPPQPNQNGHYELRTVSRWVPASYQQVFVPGRCGGGFGFGFGFGRHHGFRPHFCTAGYYTQQYVPGHMTQVQEYVFVADAYNYGGYGYGAQR